MFVTNLKILGQLVPEKSLTKISIFIIHYKIGEIEKRKNRKRRQKLSTLVLFTVIHLIVLIVYIKFEDCGTHR